MEKGGEELNIEAVFESFDTDGALQHILSVVV